MKNKNLKLKTIGTNLAINTQVEYSFDEIETSKVLLEALDTLAFKYQVQHNEMEYDLFKTRVINEIDRVRGIIATAKPI